MRLVPFSALFAFLFLAGNAIAADWNAQVLESIARMPEGGVYARFLGSKKGAARYTHLYRTVEDLSAALAIEGSGRLKVSPKRAKEFSFCSSATYLVFCDVVASLQAKGIFPEDPAIGRELLDIGTSESVIHGEKDGIGIFGHWNADGPGTAVLFERLDLGRNFTQIEQAKPGDFLKIFWNDLIGKGEKGHLVVYLGRDEDSGAVHVWSSNLQNEDGSGGYGTMWIDRSRIFRMVFSRLERPENLQKWLSFSGDEKTSEYLVRIRQVPSSESGMKSATGMEDHPSE